MEYTPENPPIVCMMTNSTCYKGTRPMAVKGVLWHSTGANNPTLRRYVQPSDNDPRRAALLQLLGKNEYGNDWNHIYLEAGVNAFIGKLADGTVAAVQTMPWTYRPWGCGSGVKGSCNDGWIQFEICEDGLKNEAYFNAIYKTGVALTAYLCRMFGLDPRGTAWLNGVKVPVILCHKDSYELGLGSAHSDVMNWLPRYGKSMATVREDVAAVLRGDEVDMSKDEVIALVRDTVAAVLAAEPVYNTVEESPPWAREELREALELGVLKGSPEGLGLTLGDIKAVLYALRAAKLERP